MGKAGAAGPQGFDGLKGPQGKQGSQGERVSMELTMIRSKLQHISQLFIYH